MFGIKEDVKDVLRFAGIMGVFTEEDF